MDAQLGYVRGERLRDGAREAGHLHLAEDHLEDALGVADPHRLADVAQGDGDLDGLVHRHFLQVDVDQILGDGVELHVPDDGHPLVGESPKVTWSSWVPPSWPWMRRKISLGLTVMFTGMPPP